MGKGSAARWGLRIAGRDGQQAGGDPPAPDAAAAEALAKAQYEAESARAETAKMKKLLDELKEKLPSDEQRAKWADLESKQAADEEARRRKEGEFDSWRAQIAEKHDKELGTVRQEAQNAAAQAASHERELNDTLIGLAFSGATDWFGPTGKTVLLPAVAQSYFAHNVEIEVVPAPNGGKPTRRVIVKDNTGTVLIDPKTSKPLPFDKAIGELIENHPQKNHLLRGSGRVGSGSAGGTGGTDSIDLSRLKPADFQDPAVREKVRQSMAQPGGLQIGPGFERLRKSK